MWGRFYMNEAGRRVGGGRKGNDERVSYRILLPPLFLFYSQTDGGEKTDESLFNSCLSAFYISLKGNGEFKNSFRSTSTP